MSENELFDLLLSYPALTVDTLNEWLKTHTLTEPFLDRFRFILQSGDLCFLDEIDVKWFVKYPDIFRKDYWMKTTMDYHALENKEFQQLARLSDDDLMVVAQQCNPANGGEITEKADMEFLKRNVNARWMQMLAQRLSDEVLTNLRIDAGFAFTQEGLEIAQAFWDKLDITPAIPQMDMMIRDVIIGGGEIDLKVLLNYGTQAKTLTYSLVEGMSSIHLKNTNCFTLPLLFDVIPSGMWAQGVRWLDYNGVLTKPLLESLFEDVNFSSADKVVLKPILVKYNVVLPEVAPNEGETGMD